MMASIYDDYAAQVRELTGRVLHDYTDVRQATGIGGAGKGIIGDFLKMLSQEAYDYELPYSCPVCGAHEGMVHHEGCSLSKVTKP